MLMQTSLHDAAAGAAMPLQGVRPSLFRLLVKTNLLLASRECSRGTT